jgi:hypothetical protein
MDQLSHGRDEDGEVVIESLEQSSVIPLKERPLVAVDKSEHQSENLEAHHAYNRDMAAALA